MREAGIKGILHEHPRPALGRSLGCVVVDEGCTTRLTLINYKRSNLARAQEPSYLRELEAAHFIEAVEHG